MIFLDIICFLFLSVRWLTTLRKWYHYIVNLSLGGVKKFMKILFWNFNLDGNWFILIYWCLINLIFYMFKNEVSMLHVQCTKFKCKRGACFELFYFLRVAQFALLLVTSLSWCFWMILRNLARSTFTLTPLNFAQHWLHKHQSTVNFICQHALQMHQLFWKRVYTTLSMMLLLMSSLLRPCQ